MKRITVGKLNVDVCEHKGDITYDRYVKFKQYAPQFWEKMDSPLFEVYWEKFQDFHNKGEHAQALMCLRDYKIALDNSKNSYDAWGVCFALITEIHDGDDAKTAELFKLTPNETAIEAKLKRMNEEGLTAETVKESVLDFMQTSPETFMEHLTVYGILASPSETQNLSD